MSLHQAVYQRDEDAITELVLASPSDNLNMVRVLLEGGTDNTHNATAQEGGKNAGHPHFGGRSHLGV